jgi:glyoxylase-like metal-dependent hydrolase (beta-lactamase superfamily II)
MVNQRVINKMCAVALAATVVITCSWPFLASAEVRSPVLMINDEAAHAEVTVQALRGNVSVIMGSGGNIGVYTGSGGQFLVDCGIAVSKDKVSAALSTLGTGPLKFAVNTHYHWDHTDGNEWVRSAGATVIAHENTLKRLAAGTRVIEWGFYFPPLPPGALPDVTVKTEKTYQFEGETIVIGHLGPSHTDTDLVVHFKSADVLQVGDIWWNGHYPFIDNGGGGTVDGLIASINKLIGMASARTLIIPGHGPVGDRNQLVGFRDMLVTVRNNVARLKKQGKTLSETIAARPTAQFDQQYGDFVISPAFFVQLVYMDV